MFRRCVIARVHLFSALLPTNLVKPPVLITPEHFVTVKVALDEAKPFLGKSHDKLVTSMEMCVDTSAHSNRSIMGLLDGAVESLRGELYKPEVKDPFHRLQVHEAIMAAGFYQRAANPNVLHGEGTRFVLNHFNFDIRRDTVITKCVHDSVLAGRKPTPESDKLLSDLFLLERKLFGHYRFLPTGGKRWFCLGVSFDEITTEAEIMRLLDLSPVKSNGNFSLKKIDNEKETTFKLEVEPKEEPSFFSARDLQAGVKPSELVATISIIKPPRALDFWERLREALLRYWVIWISFWIIFFMIDEEVIALGSLIFLKWKAMRNLKREADETGEKVYVARSSR